MSGPDEVVYVDVDDLIRIASAALGSPPLVRDYGLLGSAASRPATVAFGQEVYPDLFDKAGALLHSLCQNHALVDGNKRLAFLATLVFLARNGHPLPDVDEDRAVTFMFDVATGELAQVTDIATALRSFYKM